MTTTDTPTSATRGPISAGSVDLWIDQRGNGPDVLLIAGLSDPPRRGSRSSKDCRIATVSRRSTTAAPLAPR